MTWGGAASFPIQHGLVFWLQLLTLALVVSSQQPDETSTLFCPSTSVMVEGELAGCILTPKSGGESIVASWSDLGVTTDGIDIGIIDPLPVWGASSQFIFSLLAGPRSGLASVSANVLTTEVRIMITAIADGTSNLTCDREIINVQERMQCTISPRNNGTEVYSLPVFFPGSGGHLVFSTVQPQQPSRHFSFTASSGTFSERTFITNGISAKQWPVTVVDVPDTTSSLNCDVVMWPVSQPINCVITPRTRGHVSFVLASSFNLSTDSLGTFSSLGPTIADRFPFTLLPGPESGKFFVRDAVSEPLMIALYDIPDGSSILQCDDDIIAFHGTIACSILPRKEDSKVFARYDIWVLSAEYGVTREFVGFFSGISPVDLSNGFNFTYTAGDAEGPVYIKDGVSAQFELQAIPPELPGPNSSLSCLNDTLLPLASTTCTIVAMKQGASIWSTASSFRLSDEYKAKRRGGSFSPLLPEVARVFQFTYTAGILPGKVWIANGLSAPFLLTVIDTTVVSDHTVVISVTIGIYCTVLLMCIPVCWLALNPMCKAYVQRRRKRGLVVPEEVEDSFL